MDIQVYKTPVVYGTITLTLLAFSFFKFKSCYTSKEIQLKEKVEEINKRLTYLEIYPTTISLGNRYMNEAYVVRIKKDHQKDCYMFNVYEYIIAEGESLTGTSQKDICKIIEEMKSSEKQKVIDAWDKIHVDLEASPVPGFTAKANDVLRPLVELAYIVATIGKEYSVNIYIKGFADGYKRPWKRPFDKASKYYYSSISYLPNLDSGSVNPFNYSQSMQSYKLEKDSFENKDLPNLRAQFILDEIVNKLKFCDGFKIHSVQILEGFQWQKDTINFSKRKVQLYITEAND